MFTPEFNNNLHNVILLNAKNHVADNVGIFKKFESRILNFRIIMVERQSSEKLDITIYFWGLVCRYVGVSATLSL